MIIVIDLPKFEPNAPLVECGSKDSRVIIVIDRPNSSPALLVESAGRSVTSQKELTKLKATSCIKSTPGSGVAVS